MDNNEMSKFLIEQRKNNNYTQKDISDFCCVSTQAVSKWERGESVPDITILEKLSKLYHCSINEIINVKIDKKDKNVNKKYAISITFSIFVFISYFLNFVEIYMVGGPNIILRGYEVIFNSTSGTLTIVSWLIFLVLMSYLFINIFTVTNVIKLNNSIKKYVSISGILSILLTLTLMIMRFYIILPHLIIIICIILEMQIIGYKNLDIKKVSKLLIEDNDNIFENKIIIIIYIALTVIVHIFILVGMFVFYSNDVIWSDTFSVILVPVSWLILSLASFYFLKQKNNKRIKIKLLEFIGVIILVTICFGAVQEAIDYASIYGILIFLVIYIIINLLYYITLLIKPKKINQK